MKELLLIAIGAALVNNVVLSQFLGICPFLGVSKQVKTAAGMGGAVLFVITLASIVTSLIYDHVLVAFGLEYLQTIVFILVIAGLVQFVEMFLKKNMVALYQSLGVFLPLITTNCAVLGVTVLNIDEGYTFVQSIFNSLGAGIGFLLAMVLFAGLRGKLEKNTLIPESFKGIPITLVTASILSLTFMGFSGMVDGIFS